MAVQVYGCNHIVIEVTDAKAAVKFYSDVFGLEDVARRRRRGLVQTRRTSIHGDF
jgi:catechol 2,3-dioxygenase-like lactoylglutathione lyase family enzyme